MKKNKVKKLKALCVASMVVSLVMNTISVPTFAGVTTKCEMDSDCTGIHLVGGKEYKEVFTPSNAFPSNATDGNAVSPIEIKYHIHNINCYNLHEDENCQVLIENGGHAHSACNDYSQGLQCGYEDATEEMLKELTCLTDAELSTIKAKKLSSALTATITPRPAGEEHVFRVLSSRYQKSIHQSKRYGEYGYNEAEVFLLVDYSKDYESNTWTIDDSVYTPGISNYLIAYCCDGDTGVNTNAYYRQINLEDSTYFSDDVAEKVRAIVKNAYPFIDADTVRKNLVEANVMSVEEASKVDEADLIMASQHAIWRTTNPYTGEIDPYTPYVSDGHHYAVTANRSANAYQPTITAHRPSGSKNFYPAVGERIEKVTSYLTRLAPIPAEESEIIVSTVSV